MSEVDIEDLRRSIGTKVIEQDVATRAPLSMLIATFDRNEEAPREGEAIPPGWHIGYFLAMSRPAALAEDGLPSSSGVLSCMPFPRRMYAGCRMAFHGEIRVGDQLSRETSLADIQLRKGSTGALIITTQRREIRTARGLAMVEEYDSVFREEVKPGEKSAIPSRDEMPAGMPWQRTITTDVVSLFRFSAITFNPHRIHYDRGYATGVEGYPGLVVHGPYSQHCLIDFVRDHNPGRAITRFDMRARAPLFDTEPFHLVGRPAAGGGSAEVWAVTSRGTIAMQAVASLA